jgi:hypothetical protein
MEPLSLPDIPVYNLYIFLREGQVMDNQIQSLDRASFFNYYCNPPTRLLVSTTLHILNPALHTSLH